jgi:SAM-dependent methyltransferase
VLPATALLLVAVGWRYRPKSDNRFRDLLSLACALVIVGIYAWELARREIAAFADDLFLERNFYGSLRVEDVGAVRSLLNGNIVHGRELLSPSATEEPISYYNPESGIGIALTELGKEGPLKVGTIGLGAGMIAAYARAGDTYRFYEINPAVPEIATSYFHYVPTCKAGCDITLGDARLSLERQAPQEFDLLAIDAFSSDAIPIHMLTREAFALYWRHLKPNGVLAVHVSNLYLELGPIVALAAQADGKTVRVLDSQGYGEEFDSASWVLVTADPAFFDRPAFFSATPIAIPPGLRPWTDDYSNIWRSLR